MKRYGLVALTAAAFAAATIGIGTAGSAGRPEPSASGSTTRRAARRAPRSRRWTAAGRSSASTPSATRPSGATRCACTKPSPDAAMAASDPGVSPETALAVGLKVDVNALPAQLRANLRKGRVDLTSPRPRSRCSSSTPWSGVRGFFDDSGRAAFRRHHLRALPFRRRRLLRTRASAAGSTAGRRAISTSVTIIALSPNVQPLVDLLAHRPSGHRRCRRARRPAQLGSRQVRRRAPPRRQGDASRRKDGGDADSARVRLWPASTCTPGPAGVRSRTGTASLRISRCRDREHSSTRDSTTPRSSPSQRPRASATCATARTSSPRNSRRCTCIS